MQNLILIVIALVPPILIALYLYFRDRLVREPVKLLLLSYFLGWLIVLPILGILYGFSWSGLEDSLEKIIKPDTLLNSFWNAFIVAALIEEGFKYLAFRKWIWSNRYFDEYYDGILYAGLISLGFASLENIFYVLDYGYQTGITRAVTAIPAHAFFGIAMGYFLSRAKFNFTKTKQNLWLAFLIPVLLHGVYDLIAFEIARFDDPDDPWFYPMVILFWGLMIFMFFYARKNIKRLINKDKKAFDGEIAEVLREV